MGVQPGKFVDAFSYNGMLPGPEIRVTEGDKVRFNVTNNLPESTAIHWHGVMVPNAHGWRAVHYPTADQTGKDIHLRVHDP